MCPEKAPQQVPWEPPAAAALPEFRATMARQMASQWEVSQLAEVLASGRGSLVPNARTPKAAAKILCEQERQRLSEAELYFVTAEMTTLAVAAGESLPDFHLEPEDVPARHGFIVFAVPIGSYINTDGGLSIRFPIVAVSWGPVDPAMFPHWRRGGVWFTYYSPTDLAGLERQMRQLAGRPIRPAERARLRQMRGPLMWDNEAALGYGGDEKANYKPGDSHHGDPGRAAPWPQTLRAAWLLMNQSNNAEAEQLHRSRASVRRDEHDGLNPGAVRLIHLRRATKAQGAPHDEKAAREYTCRWMVRGHWRQQWYPSRQVHRPVWITPHLKGPEDKPIRAGDTVYLWDR
jgi:hypothetical protein